MAFNHQADDALIGTWDALKIQLSPFSRVITMRNNTFDGLDDTARNFIANSMM
jgi:hypothetical protein